MTIVNMWVGHEYALVGTDSECKDGAGNIDTVSKILTLPHMNAVIAGSGQHVS